MSIEFDKDDLDHIAKITDVWNRFRKSPQGPEDVARLQREEAELNAEGMSIFDNQGLENYVMIYGKNGTNFVEYDTLVKMARQAGRTPFAFSEN